MPITLTGKDEKEFKQWQNEKHHHDKTGHTEKHDGVSVKPKKHRPHRKGMSPIQELHMETQVLRIALLTLMDNSPADIRDGIIKDMEEHDVRKSKYEAENFIDPQELELMARNSAAAQKLHEFREKKKVKDDETKVHVAGVSGDARAGLEAPALGASVLRCGDAASDSDED